MMKKMAMPELVRLSGLAAIAGGFFIILARVFQVWLFGSAPLSVQTQSPYFVAALGVPGLLGSMGLSLGLVGLYARQAERLGSWGLALFLVAYAGLSLSLGANWAYAFAAPFLEQSAPGLVDAPFDQVGWGVLGSGFLISYLAGALSWLSMSAATIYAGVLPRWVGAGMLVSMLLAATLPLGTDGLPGILVNVLLATGPCLFGYALWSEA